MTQNPFYPLTAAISVESVLLVHTEKQITDWQLAKKRAPEGILLWVKELSNDWPNPPAGGGEHLG